MDTFNTLSLPLTFTIPTQLLPVTWLGNIFKLTLGKSLKVISYLDEFWNPSLESIVGFNIVVGIVIST